MRSRGKIEDSEQDHQSGTEEEELQKEAQKGGYQGNPETDRKEDKWRREQRQEGKRNIGRVEPGPMNMDNTVEGPGPTWTRITKVKKTTESKREDKNQEKLETEQKDIEKSKLKEPERNKKKKPEHEESESSSSTSSDSEEENIDMMKEQFKHAKQKVKEENQKKSYK